MKKIIKALKEYCQENKLVVNVRKTKVVIFEKGRNRSKNKYKFEYDGLEIKIVNNYKFLGIEFFSSGVRDGTSKVMLSKASLRYLDRVEKNKHHT